MYVFLNSSNPNIIITGTHIHTPQYAKYNYHQERSDTCFDKRIIYFLNDWLNPNA